MEKEMPTFINTNMDVKDVKKSDSVITLKNIDANHVRNSQKCKEIVQQSREELLIEQSSEVKPVHHRGLLIERGIIEYPCDYEANHAIDELIGDFESKGKFDVPVKQSSDVFVEKLILNPKYAQMKGILIENGIMQDSNNKQVQKTDKDQGDFAKNAKYIEEEYILQSSSDMKPSYLQEVLVETGLMESWVKETRAKSTKVMGENSTNAKGIRKDCKKTKERSWPTKGEPIPAEIEAIMNDINTFTAHLDNNQNMEEWQQFRANLLTVHQYYMSQWDKDDEKKFECKPDEQVVLEDLELEKDLIQVEYNVDNMLQPLNDLIQHSKSLAEYIACIEDKINRLDFNVDHFYAKYNQSLLNREKAYQDMMALQELRERIGKRLTHIELEIHASKARLRQRGMQNK